MGQKFDSSIVKKYREWFPFYDIGKDEERGKTQDLFFFLLFPFDDLHIIVIGTLVFHHDE